MGEQKRNDPESLRQSGGELGSLGERIDTRWQELVSESESKGDPFGDDMVGGLIGAAYGSVMQIANETFSSGAADFRGFGDGLKVAADTHEATETANTQEAGGLGPQIEGIREV